MIYTGGALYVLLACNLRQKGGFQGGIILSQHNLRRAIATYYSKTIFFCWGPFINCNVFNFFLLECYLYYNVWCIACATSKHINNNSQQAYKANKSILPYRNKHATKLTKSCIMKQHCIHEGQKLVFIIICFLSRPLKRFHSDITFTCQSLGLSCYQGSFDITNLVLYTHKH